MKNTDNKINKNILQNIQETIELSKVASVL